VGLRQILGDASVRGYSHRRGGRAARHIGLRELREPERAEAAVSKASMPSLARWARRAMPRDNVRHRLESRIAGISQGRLRKLVGQVISIRTWQSYCSLVAGFLFCGSAELLPMLE
jgi:hypothetical protein